MKTLVLTLLGMLSVQGVGADESLSGLVEMRHSARLQQVVEGAVAKAAIEFSAQKLTTNELAVTLVDLGDPLKPAWASVRGMAPIYPASVVKLFYLLAAQQWLADGRLADTAELRRALRDMIVDSSNDASHYVVDLLTETTSGPELPEPELKVWWEKRNAVNRHFAMLGYTGINVSKKPWCEGPYGREMQAIKAFTPTRNLLTTDATARLLVEIVAGRAVSKERSAAMMELLKRDPFSPTTDPDDQGHGFTGLALKPGMKLWSKAGWTSETHHDAACVELPGGRKFVLVTFTENHATERQIIPAIARVVIDELTRGQ